MYALKCVRSGIGIVFKIGEIYHINSIDITECESNKLIDNNVVFEIDITKCHAWSNEVKVRLKSSVYEFEIVEVQL